MQLITQKIYRLAELMKDPTITPSERLLLLVEIAEDAQRLKMGSEDKIRVAGRTCDDVRIPILNQFQLGLNSLIYVSLHCIINIMLKFYLCSLL